MIAGLNATCFVIYHAFGHVILDCTLQVLKSYGLIDVRQEQPYSDITLKLTSTFSKAQI